MNKKEAEPGIPNRRDRRSGFHRDHFPWEDLTFSSRATGWDQLKNRLRAALDRWDRNGDPEPEELDPPDTAAPYAVFVIDDQGHIQSCNQACHSLLKYGREMIGMPLPWLLWNREEAELVEQMVQAVFREGRSFESVELRYRDRSDQVCHSLTRLYPIFDSRHRVKACGFANLRVGDLKQTLFALRESENMFRKLVQESPDGIFLLDEGGIVVEWNPMMESLTGVPRAEALGQPGELVWALATPEEMSSPDRQERTRRILEKFRATGKGHFLNRPAERRIEDPQGAARYIQEQTFAIETDKGYLLAGVLRDISDRKFVELAESERRMLAETLRETFLDMSRLLEPDDVLDRILDHLERVVPCDAALISLFENGRAVTRRYQGAGSNGPPPGHRAPLPVKGAAYLERLSRSGRPHIVPDLWEDPEWTSTAENGWARCAVSAPLFFEERAAGFLTLYSAQPKFYHSQHADRLALFAEQAAVALQNARLFHDLNRYARQAGLLNEIAQEGLRASSLPEMLERLAERLQVVYESHGVYVMLWDEEHQVPIPGAAKGPTGPALNSLRFQPGEQTFTKAVLTAGRVLVVEDLHTQRDLYPVTAHTSTERALMGLPLVADDRWLGVVTIAFKQPRLFSPEEIALAEQAARQLSLVLAKAQMLEGERERKSQVARTNALITTLSRVVTELETRTDPDSGLQSLGSALRKLNLNSLVALAQQEPLEFDIRYISLDFARLRQLEAVAGFARQEFRLGPQRFLGYNQVVVRRQPLFLPDPLPALRHALPELPQTSLYPIARMIGITVGVKAAFLPLAVEERVMGLLLVWGADMQEGDLAALHLFANQVAAALHRAELYREIQQMAITDPLTNLYNRRGFFELGHREFERSQRFNRPLVAAMLDIDHFKEINDRHGHGVGDQVLDCLARLCLESVREIDLVGRYGGEEFVLLLPENDLASGSEVGERLRRRVEATPAQTDAGEIAFTISLGLARMDARTPDLDGLIDRADQALYQAKQQGRNRVVAVP